jgi:hypothetical protein
MKKDLNELSRTGILSRYISKARTQANSPGTSTRTALKRERGIDLARKKKWGGIEDMPGKPAKVVGTSMKKEEAEQIDELSVDALERYKRKAGEQMKQNTDATATHDRVAKPGKEKVVAKRIAGRSLATHKQVQQMYKQMNKEEYGDVSMKSFNQFIAEAATKVHPNAIHVSDAGAGKYKVHAVGSEHADRIKVGEHLTDTELDDFSEMGGKIKNVKAKD